VNLPGNCGKTDIELIGDRERLFFLPAQDKPVRPGAGMYRLLAASLGCQLVGGPARESDGLRHWKGHTMYRVLASSLGCQLAEGFANETICFR
jgi:hypothetical protein